MTLSRVYQGLALGVFGLAAVNVAPQEPRSPQDLCALHLAAVGFSSVPQLPVDPTSSSSVLKPSSGFHILVATLKGSVPADGVISLSPMDISASYGTSATRGRALALAQRSDTLAWVYGSAGVMRDLRAGAVTLSIAFIVPQSVTEVDVTVPTRIPRQQPLSPRP
jgi:hypothetical protein